MLKILMKAPRLLAPVARIYGRRLDECGATAKGVFWKDEAWQIKRFERMAEIFDTDDLQSGGVAINDFGCGYGAFFDFLAARPVMNGSRYFGYDISQEMIAACRDRITDPRAKFLRKMWATEFADYSFACGTYNMHGRADAREWMEYVEASLEQLWSKTRRALAFNMLRDDEPEQYQGLYYVDPERLRRFCATKLTANLEIFDERPLPDITFFLRR
jgi:SAM-dependent methyltransferase